MKIDRTKLKKSSSEVPADCKNLIDKLKVKSLKLEEDEIIQFFVGMQSRSVPTRTEKY